MENKALIETLYTVFWEWTPFPDPESPEYNVYVKLDSEVEKWILNCPEVSFKILLSELKDHIYQTKYLVKWKTHDQFMIKLSKTVPLFLFVLDLSIKNLILIFIFIRFSG